MDATSLAGRIIARIRGEDQVWGPYPLDLSLDAILELYQATGEEKFREEVLRVMSRRQLPPGEPIPYASQPFGHVSYRLIETDQYFLTAGVAENKDAAAFVGESFKYLREVPRSREGLVLHWGKVGEPARVLVDSMQNYASRMARAGKLTGDQALRAECAEQFRLHRNLLRDPKSGLWSQGRGWENDPGEISEGAWSRGQGWVLRGMVDALEALPPESAEHPEIMSFLGELLDALLPLQGGNGMWHALPHLAWRESPSETSGTALICRALYRALAAGWVCGEKYQTAADHAFRAVTKSVAPDGTVTGACAGPGPLTRKLAKNYRSPRFEEDPDHGRFAVLYACAAKARYDHYLVWLTASFQGTSSKTFALHP